MSSRTSRSSGTPGVDTTSCTGERSSSPMAAVAPPLPTTRCRPSTPFGERTSRRPDNAARNWSAVSGSSSRAALGRIDPPSTWSCSCAWVTLLTCTSADLAFDPCALPDGDVGVAPHSGRDSDLQLGGTLGRAQVVVELLELPVGPAVGDPRELLAVRRDDELHVVVVACLESHLRTQMVARDDGPAKRERAGDRAARSPVRVGHEHARSRAVLQARRLVDQDVSVAVPHPTRE